MRPRSLPRTAKLRGVILGLEISRAGASAVISDPNGATQWASRCTWLLHAPPREQWLSAMQLCRDLLQRAALETAQIERIGVAFDALVEGGIVQTDPTRPGFAGYDIARAATEHLGIARSVAASLAACRALGEVRFGALQNQPNWIYLHMSDELHGAMCFAHQILPGDLGGLLLERDGSIDAFGKRGTLRAYCSGAAFEGRARSYGMSAQSASEIWAMSGSNFAAQSLCEDFTSRLAQGLAGAAALLPGAPVCLGGSFGAAIWPRAADLASKLREMAPKSPQLLPASLGEDAATLGAVALALQTEF